MRSSLWLIAGLLCASAAAQEYAPALPGYHYQFPRDDFSHPEYGTEWWYYTGNLRTKDGHRFGYELTFFRQGITRAQDASPWFIRNLYLADLALSDLDGNRYYEAERVNRAGPGIAGAEQASATVWNGNWQTRIGGKEHLLQAVADDFSLELRVAPEKPAVINGENGLSQKEAGAGRASHYISYTRMKTAGTVRLRGTEFQVEGDTWMDHEFFTEPAGGNEVGWDWLSLQLEDNTELMLYRLRHRDGSVDPYSSGTYIDRDGRAQHLNLSDFSLMPAGARWKSPGTGADYPVSWSVTIPRLKLQLAVSTPLNGQEFVSRVGPSYWEGAIDVKGSRDGQAVRGAGYLEMTGYASHQSPLLPSSAR